MILSLNLPRVGELMAGGRVHKLIARPGDSLRPGTPLLEMRVDLGAAGKQDCPPVFYFRLIATEKAHLCSFSVTAGDTAEVGARLGVATTAAGEPFDGAAVRGLRTMSVSIQVDPLSS